jgi:hypothetical protein
MKSQIKLLVNSVRVNAAIKYFCFSAKRPLRHSNDSDEKRGISLELLN